MNSYQEREARTCWRSWVGLLRDAKRRGMRAPVLAVGDRALGFWAAARGVSRTRRAALLGSTKSWTFSTACRRALVLAGAKFEEGVLIERPDKAETKVAA